MIDRSPSSAVVARAVAAVLAAERVGGGVASVIGDASDLAESVLLHRVHHVVGPYLADLGFDEDDRRHLTVAGRRSAAHGLANMAHTAAASKTLHDAGVDHLVVKGVAISAGSGRHPAARGSADIDIWVDPSSVEAAEVALGSAGWHRPQYLTGLPRPGDGWRWRVTDWIRPELPLDHPERAQIDLHWRLVPDRREMPYRDFAAAHADSVPLPEIGPTVRTLSPVATLLHIAQHGRKDGFATLRHLTDITDAARRIPDATLSELVGEHPNLRLAFATAAPIAPWLLEFVIDDRRCRRLGDDAYRTCLALRRSIPVRRSLSGSDARRSRLDREWWRIRSAPSALVAGRSFMVMVAPQRLLFSDERNPVRRLARSIRR